MEARKNALESLNKIFTRKEYSNIVISKTINEKRMSDLDRGLYTQLVYGVLKNKFLLDFYLRPYTDGKKIKDWMRHLLELSIYQMIFLDRIPTYAILNDAVEIAKAIDFNASKLINAVLRNFEVQKEPTEEHIKYSINEWLYKQIKGQYGEDYKLILDSFMLDPKLSARVNSYKTSRDKIVSETVVPSKVTKTGVIYTKGNIANTGDYIRGFVSVQDEASQLVARTMNPKKTDVILDVCAAPGGKTTHMAEIMKNEGRIIANDIHSYKLDLIKQNADRLGLTNIEYTDNDGTKLKRIHSRESFDKILLDAPCSGWGVIGRKPEIKFFQSQQAVDDLTAIQAELLNEVSTLVKVEGILVYSTCTINKGENEVQIKKFLQANDNYELVKENFILPYENHTDGFYIAKMKKVRR